MDKYSQSNMYNNIDNIFIQSASIFVVFVLKKEIFYVAIHFFCRIVFHIHLGLFRDLFCSLFFEEVTVYADTNVIEIYRHYKWF